MSMAFGLCGCYDGFSDNGFLDNAYLDKNEVKL